MSGQSKPGDTGRVVLVAVVVGVLAALALYPVLRPMLNKAPSVAENAEGGGQSRSDGPGPYTPPSRPAVAPAIPAPAPEAAPEPAPPPAPKPAPTMAGAWRGSYGYSGSTQRVSFDVQIKADGMAFSGRMSEPNTFGDPSAAYLYANISGVLDKDGNLSFIKTYDGTGGVSHSVTYYGVLEGDRIVGTYQLPGGKGPFEMERAS